MIYIIRLSIKRIEKRWCLSCKKNFIQRKPKKEQTIKFTKKTTENWFSREKLEILTSAEKIAQIERSGKRDGNYSDKGDGNNKWLNNCVFN